MPDRTSSVGLSLARVPDRCLFAIVTFFTADDLLWRTSLVSWVWYHLSNSEEVWRRLALLDHVDEDTKLATFSFKGCWKLTYLHPARDSILLPVVMHSATPDSNGLAKQPAEITNGGGDQKAEAHPPDASGLNRMFVVAVEDWKLQNRALIAKLITPPGHPLPRTEKSLALIPEPRMLSDVTNWRHLPRSYSINHPHGVRAPPLYATLQARDTYTHYNVLGEDLLKWPMNLCIPRRDKLSLKEFQEQYEIPNLPVVITGMTDHWPARWKWRPDNFAQFYKETPLKCNGRSTDGRRFRMPGFDFMSYCTSWNGEKSLYVFDKKVFQHSKGRALLRDYDILPYFSDDLFDLMDFDDRPDFRWLLVGPSGCGSPFHQDPHATSAWNAVMSGVKRVSFYPPGVVPPGVDAELIDSDYYASDDMMEWYRNTYPRLPPEQRPLECLVYPGDVVYIPSMWWHSVMNIGMTIAVTQNLCSTNNFFRVAEEINRAGGKHIRKDFRNALEASPQHRHLAHHIQLKRG